jgi:KUP system potassium uptake protein
MSTVGDGSLGKPVRSSVFLAVLGVVYGDIGTSPLYAMRASVAQFGNLPVSAAEVMGILSLIFWSLILVVTIKYVTLIMRADNRGEGGILALMALAQRVSVAGRMRRTLGFIGITGACLFFGDGLITPAISVLSAIEGVEVSAPALRSYVLPISTAVIIGLFLVQRRGTGSVGMIFGPVMAIWFLLLGLLGLIEVVRQPFVLLALSPSYAIGLCLEYKVLAFIVLGSVVLCVTGAEALYTDMGHFGASPIRTMWIFFVLPCLVLNYLGQGALIIKDPTVLTNPFFLLAPDWLRLPMVVLATLATVIASQAVISGAYSVARQCIQLNLLPRMAVRHTSISEQGQIFIPRVNAIMALGVVILIFAFKTSESLAAAYGIAVTGTFLCDCTLATVVFRREFHWSRPATLLVFGTFFLIDATFLAANSMKFIEGGWVPLVFATSLIAVMTTWLRGRELILARWRQDSLPIAPFLTRLPQSRTLRVPGIAVFLTSNAEFVPGALLHNLKHNKVLHERVLFVTVETTDEPEVESQQRAEVSELVPGIYRVILRYGFMESPDIPFALQNLKDIHFDTMQTSFFLGRDVLVPALVPRMSAWRYWLFLLLARNAVSATEFFRIPYDRVVELGARVAI